MPYVDLASPCGETRLAEQRGLLVAERGGHRDAVEDAALGVAVHLGGGPDLRQYGGGDLQRRDDLVVPLHRVEVHQEGARGVGDVGDVHAAVRASGQIPDDPGVHRPEEDVAPLGALAQPLDVVEQPAHLRAGEVRRERQARLAAEAVLADVAAELLAERVGAGVLPDEGVVDGLTGVLVPEQGGLALVGDADRLDVGGGDTRLDDRPGDDLLDVLPDLIRVVFDPARLGEDLLVLLLVDGDDPAVLVEDDAAAGRGALVDGRDERAGGVCVGHGWLPEVCAVRR